MPFGETARPTYKVEKLTYESEPGIAIPALLFVPNGGPARKPAVIFADGRGKASAAAEAEQLAAKGYIILVPDLRGLGETQPPLDRRDSFVHNFGDYKNTLTGLLVGKTMVGMRAADVVRAVDVLAARPDVDSISYRRCGAQPPLPFQFSSPRSLTAAFRAWRSMGCCYPMTLSSTHGSIRGSSSRSFRPR